MVLLLYPDNVGTKIGKQHCSVRPRTDAGNFDLPEPLIEGEPVLGHVAMGGNHTTLLAPSPSAEDVLTGVR